MAGQPNESGEVPKRFLPERRVADRRGAGKRREADRRVIDMAVERERRRDGDRRHLRERRMVAERRFPSAAQFSWDDTLTIHRMLTDPTLDVSCPRCHGRLLLGPPDRNVELPTREVHCTSCRYSVAIVDES
ncbi:MAG: hypothetical protein OEO20_07670 [Gemmatimonadota bacterium]|nr:hypothetical protein [Gemmatimonadota bacterium]MDH3478168.1 hypothetical protein [Gemmatimonadota bacterium]MDH3569409.1 hypothetical protein [Gemmatimonadota bacterium]MDH5549349.1 hypothetical protein [Gemmatimonadota bacterium]